MKMTVDELREAVRGAVAEVRARGRKKDGKGDDPGEDHAAPGGYGTRAAVNDFSTPLDGANRYRREGASNMGPYTGEAVVRSYVGSIVKEILSGQALVEAVGPFDPSASAWMQVSALVEKHIGFKRLAGQLARRKGVSDPRALAASIGRRKYGAKKMAKMSAAGRRK